MKKHILVISQYFYPEQFRINDMCTEWVKRGYEVTAITGIPNYPQGKYYANYSLFKKREENFNGVNIVRLPLIPRGNNSFMMILNYFSFVISGYFWQLFTKIDADLVFIFEVSPMTQALPGVWYSKKNKIPCLMYVQDLWPENVEIITGITNKYIIGSLGKMVDYIYSNCNRIFTTSNSFVKAISNRGVDLQKIEYWPQYAEDFDKPLREVRKNNNSKNNTFSIIFAGNVGYAQGLDILPKVAEYLKEKSNKKIIFNIVGDGRYKEELLKVIENNNLKDYFVFTPKQAANKIPELIATCDAGFISFSDNPIFEKTIPAKLQTYLACGIPCIGSASGETKKIINDSNCGFCSDSGDVVGLANVIIRISNLSLDELDVLGNNARKFYEENFSKEILLNKMDHHFKNFLK